MAGRSSILAWRTLPLPCAVAGTRKAVWAESWVPGCLCLSGITVLPCLLTRKPLYSFPRAAANSVTYHVDAVSYGSGYPVIQNSFTGSGSTCVQAGSPPGELVSFALQLLKLRSLVSEPPSSFKASTTWTEEPGGLQSMGPQRVKHDWVAFTSLIYPCRESQRIYSLVPRTKWIY